MQSGGGVCPMDLETDDSPADIVMESNFKNADGALAPETVATVAGCAGDGALAPETVAGCAGGRVRRRNKVLLGVPTLDVTSGQWTSLPQSDWKLTSVDELVRVIDERLHAARDSDRRVPYVEYQLEFQSSANYASSLSSMQTLPRMRVMAPRRAC